MDITQQYFTCKKCGETKIWGEFPKAKDRKNGIEKKCKTCRNAAELEIYKIKRDDINLKRRARYVYNPDKRDKRSEYMREWRLKNIGKPRKQRSRKIADKEKYNAKRRNRYAKDADYAAKYRLSAKLYASSNPIAKIKVREHNKSGRKEVGNYYASSLLKSKGFTREQIAQNPELINIQRIIIQTKRLCKI